MGTREQTSQSAVAKQEADLQKLNDELKLDLAQAAIDIAGIADPTPISDVIGAGLSVYRGDYIGAALSLVSVIPYAGDALGKTAKGARLAKKIAGMKKKIAAAITALNKVKAAKSATRREAAAALRAERKAEKAKEFVKAKKKQPCNEPSGNRYATQSPKEGSNGSWRGGERGNSTWYPDPNTEKGREVLEATGGKPIQFKDGYPDFSPHAKYRVEIDMQGSSTDFTAARDTVRKQLNDPKWETPDGWTWHHNHDGTTMELVPSNLNNNVPHTGGDSLAQELKQDPGY